MSGRTPLATICSKTLRAPSRSPSLQCPFLQELFECDQNTKSSRQRPGNTDVRQGLTKDEYVIVLGSMPSFSNGWTEARFIWFSVGPSVTLAVYATSVLL